jgi:protein AIR1/2
MAYTNLKEADVIDLTSPPPPLESVVFDSDTEFDLDVSTGIPYDLEKFPKETQRKRLNKSSAGTDGGDFNKMATMDMKPPELNPSGRHGKRKREIDTHNREVDHDLQRRRAENTQVESPKPLPANIFFVDVQPTPPADTTPPFTLPQEEPAKKLLLPAHVTVFGTTPAEILPEPIAEEDEDDFINYLDLDDTRVRSLYNRASCPHFLSTDASSIL